MKGFAAANLFYVCLFYRVLVTTLCLNDVKALNVPETAQAMG